MWVARVVLVCGALALARARGEGLVVSTAQGPVRGYPSELGDFFAFYGIPYATAPTGKDKFKEPLPPPIWNNVFEATDDKIACPQPTLPLMHDTMQQENCLIINVLVPNSPHKQDKTFSVIAYVHGGAFALGIGNSATHELLLQQDIIVVNFNYRVGTYGFLCLGTKDIPGNAGLKDQVAALKWIQRNIAKFGGNPKEVTLVGSSAGSAIVEFLMLSPMAKGLFTKAISESGSALSTWAMDPDPVAMAKLYAADISNKRLDSVIELEEFYKSLTMEQLTSKLYLAEPDSSVGFAPCVETKIDGQDSFLIESPLNILKSGRYNKVPYMTGFASEEGLFRIDLFDNWKDKMENNFADFLPRDLNFKSDYERNVVATKVKRFYFKDEPISNNTIRQFVDYFTDILFGYSTVRSAKLHAAKSVPVYLYEFSYVPEKYPDVPYAHKDKINGAFHGAQSFYVHDFNFAKSNASENDGLMKSRLSMMWKNFVTFGTPVLSTSELLPVIWDKMDINNVNYFSMDVELQMKERLLGDRMDFWDSIYREYYFIPLSPNSLPVHSEL